MQLTESVQCPFCGQMFELAVDTSAGNQDYVTDCEVCCRPLKVRVECEPGEILGIEIGAG